MKNTIVSIGFHGSVDFNNSTSVSGIIVNLARVLSKQGYNFRIFCDSSGEMHLGANIPKNIAMHYYSNKFIGKGTRFYEWQKILYISYKLSKFYADVIHIHQKPEIVLGYNLLNNQNIPIIFHINSHPAAWKGSRWKRAFEKSNLVIAASKFIKRSLINKFPFLIGNIKVLHNGVDTKIFSPQKINNTLRTPKGLFTVFFAGNIWIEKGFDILLKVAQELKKEKIRFLIAGTFSPDKNHLHRQFKKNTPENVKYLGCIKHDDLAQYFASSDITIVPSRWEDPCPLVVMESMSTGTPVIGSRIGGIPELIDNGKNGFLVTPCSARELKDAILWCKNHPEALKDMRVAAFKKALRFDWRIISERLEKIYEKLLS
ncbi:glycosyltransferase family 4 protein [candidate division WOR-3 bacterium]|nr:glycosyltransferase family 4 protein [candidate division WOR-3 bacterium]